LLLEAAKRDSLRLEDLTIGTGPVAARGRRLTADVEVRYTDGTVVDRGTILGFPGFVDLVGNIRDRQQTPQYDAGEHRSRIEWHGCRRTPTHDHRSKTCLHSYPGGDPLRTQCKLIGSTFKDEVIVRKQDLIVEATLTKSCNPMIVWRALHIISDYMIKLQACREEPLPQITPGTPTLALLLN
jgi:hypothetical protein